MTKQLATLPAPFADLQPFVSEWALGSEGERFHKLVATSIEDLRAFHEAVFPRADEIKSYLDQFGLDAMPQDAMALYDLLMAFIETAHPIELKWTSTDIDDPFEPERMSFGGARPASTL